MGLHVVPILWFSQSFIPFQILILGNLFLPSSYLSPQLNCDILQCCGLMCIIFKYHAGNLMSSFNRTVLQIWKFFLIISLINSVKFLYFISISLSSTPIIWMFLVPNLPLIIFLLSSSSISIILLINWRNSSSLFPNSLVFFHLCCHFSSQELYFVPCMLLSSHLVLLSWLQYLCLFLIIM